MRTFVLLFTLFSLNLSALISTTTLPSVPQKIVWTDDDHKIGFILTFNSTIFRTADGGRTWEDQQNKLPHFHIEDGIGSVEAIITTPKPSALYFFSSLGSWMSHVGAILWGTNDTGNTYFYHPSDINYFIGEIKVNLFDPSKLLAMGYSMGCVDPSSGVPCFKTLYYSNNWGSDWSVIDTYIGDYSWGLATTEIWYTAWPDKTGNTYTKNPFNMNLYNVKYIGASIALALPNCPNLLFTENHLFVAQLFNINDPTFNVVIINNDTIVNTNLKTKYPIKVLTSTKNNIFAISVPQQAISNSTDIFIGHEGKAQYVEVFNSSVGMVLRDIQRVQFAKIEGDENFLVVNANRSGLVRRTIISFDQGYTWTSLVPPPFDSNGNPIICPYCTLNLFLQNFEGDKFSPVLSSADSPGIVLATGNIGTYYSNDSISTFISTNFGRDWEEVCQMSTTYALGPKASAIVVVANKEPTNQFLYSLDKGRSWERDVFLDGEHLILVQGVEAVSDKAFLIYGTSDNHGGGEIVRVDITSMKAKHHISIK